MHFRRCGWASPSYSSSTGTSPVKTLNRKRTSLLFNMKYEHGFKRDWWEIKFTFCQFFFNNDTRKLTLICTFWNICFSSIPQFPTATPMQSTFFSWNFTIAFVSLTFDSRDSWWDTNVGNFPELWKGWSQTSETFQKQNSCWQQTEQDIGLYDSPLLSYGYSVHHSLSHH